MTNLNENELKVGDIVSYLPKGSNFTYCVVKVANEHHIKHLKHLLAVSASWQHGIHPSLIPAGYQLISTNRLTALEQEKVDLIVRFEKKLLAKAKELEAARKEIDELRRRISDLINACADHVTVRSEYKNRIDLLESAIREFLNIENKYDECDSLKSVIDWQSLHGKSIENLRNILEKSK